MSEGDTRTTFFRLLHVPIDAKGDALAERIAALNDSASPNAAGAAEETYTLDPVVFAQIPGSPFAYWAGDFVLQAFRDLDPLEGEDRTAKRGPSSGDDFRRIRVWWEASPDSIDRRRRWVPFAKGGTFSPYYCDIHLLVDWDEERFTFRDFYGRPGREIPKLESAGFFFRPGLTWPRRPHRRVSFRILPRNCIFAENGPAILCCSESEALPLSAVLNSAIVSYLASLSMSRGTEGSGQTLTYEVGVVQRIPIPSLTEPTVRHILSTLAREAHDLQRDRDRTSETTHAFCLPGLVMHRDASTLRKASAALDAEEQARQARLAAIQTQVDDIVFDLYGLSEADRVLVRRETGSAQIDAVEDGVEDEEEAEEEATAHQDPNTRVQELLMWCLSVAFGRWDVRKALDPSLLPPLGGPFDPLPRYAPGALVDDPLGDQSAVGCPQSAIPPDGILVDDPTHSSDIVRRVRELLDLLWGERAEAIETEACEILGVKSLREYFRDPRRFFAYHIKRYSKSRRKAPIYWLLQSERRGYGIWLYYHRITSTTLYIAGRDYADGKLALESARLEDLRAGLEPLSGGARRNREREIERQEKLVAEVTAFGKTLDKIALANLPPDPNDGVLISIAPLHPLVPWSEAARMWEALRSGQYGWSTMAKQMKIVD
jgi:hypothetical protein